MKLADVPVWPAYVVCHDHYMNGAMDVWPCESLELAVQIAKRKQDYMDSMGEDGADYRAYAYPLPRRRVWKYYDKPITA